MERRLDEPNESQGSVDGRGQMPTSPCLLEPELLVLAAHSMDDNPAPDASYPIETEEDAIARHLDSLMHDSDADTSNRPARVPADPTALTGPGGSEPQAISTVLVDRVGSSETAVPACDPAQATPTSAEDMQEPSDATTGDQETPHREGDASVNNRDAQPIRTGGGVQATPSSGDADVQNPRSDGSVDERDAQPIRTGGGDQATPSSGDAAAEKPRRTSGKNRSMRRREKKKLKNQMVPADDGEPKKSKRSRKDKKKGSAETTTIPFASSLVKNVHEVSTKRSQNATSNDATQQQSPRDAKKRKKDAPKPAQNITAAQKKKKRSRSPSPSTEEPRGKDATPADKVQGSRAAQKKRAPPSPPSEDESCDNDYEYESNGEGYDSSENEFEVNPGAIVAGEKSPSSSSSDSTGGSSRDDAASDASSIWDKQDTRLRESEVPPGMHQVKRIVDYQKNRKGDILMVLAEWAKPGKGERPETWIAVSSLNNPDHWVTDFEMIDKWKESKKPRLQDFLMTKEGKKYRKKKVSYSADDGDLTCGYHAVGNAIAALQLPNPVTDESIAAFRNIGSKRRKIPTDGEDAKADSTVFSGVKWPALRAFVRQLGLIDMNVIDKNLFSGVGVGVEAIKNHKLSDGVYLIGGYSAAKLGHVIVAVISSGGKELAIHDKDSIEDVNWLHDWLHHISFIRRVQLKRD